MQQIKFQNDFNLIIHRSRLLAVGNGIIISSLATILFVAPCYFLSEGVVIIYSVAVYFLLPFAIGTLVCLMLNYYEKTSEFIISLCSLMALLCSFITLFVIFPIKEGYTGAILVMFSPLSVLINLIGIVVGGKWLSKKKNLELD